MPPRLPPLGQIGKKFKATPQGSAREPRRMKRSASQAQEGRYSKASSMKIIVYGGVPASTGEAKLAVQRFMTTRMKQVVQKVAHLTRHCRRKQICSKDVDYVLREHFAHRMLGSDEAFKISGRAQPLTRPRGKKRGEKTAKSEGTPGTSARPKPHEGAPQNRAADKDDEHNRTLVDQEEEFVANAFMQESVRHNA